MILEYLDVVADEGSAPSVSLGMVAPSLRGDMHLQVLLISGYQGQQE